MKNRTIKTLKAIGEILIGATALLGAMTTAYDKVTKAENPPHQQEQVQPMKQLTTVTDASKL